MKRREFITLIGGAAVGWPLAALAEPRLPLVGILRGGRDLLPTDLSTDLPIVRELARVGYVVGRNVTFLTRTSEDPSRLPLLARELVAAKPDVIVGAGSQAAVALFDATHDIPVVMTVVGDPIALGLTTSISRPTYNVTGFVISSLSLAAKRLQLLHDMVPSLHKAAYLWVPDSPLASTYESRVQHAAGVIGVKLVLLPLKADSDIDAAFARAEQEKVEAVLVATDPLTLRASAHIVDHCLFYGLPCMHSWTSEARNGALISYGPAAIEKNSDAANYVDRVLKGAKIAELPFVEPTDVKLIINLRTARSLGIAIPATVLIRADKVIE